MRTSLKRTIILFVAIAAFQFGVCAEEETHEDEIALVKLRPEVRVSINNALRYIAGQQNKDDGSFGQGTHSTSLALMAFMLQGHIPGQGEYGEAMEKGISFLVSKGEEQEGYLGSGTHSGGMYEHGLGILALSEAWGQSKNEKIRPVLRDAVDVLLRCQNEKGGWRYSPKIMEADISVTAMQVVGLCSARESGIAVPQKSIDKAAEYMIWCQDEETGGFGYSGPSQPAFPRSAAAALALMLSGKRDDHTVRRGMAYLKSQDDSVFDPGGKGHGGYHYSHYYAIQAMYQTSEEAFKDWYPKITRKMLDSQDPNGSWKAGHGDVYGTAMSVLVLGVPYRYLPIYQR